ncbi:MAG: type II toxin-antitoxin system VapC family toxin [Deltaproteobacteria bacterium]|nr:MAG: type II toxin-antitoxin system VapC family toxin [Deltaproteobacteria bacterium]
MEIVLLDTNIVSFLFKKDTRSVLYEPYLKNRILAISLMTAAELYQWAEVRKWGSRRVSQLERILAENYTILPADMELCRQWGKIRAECQAAGRPISPQDAWIGATAIQHDLPLITHNPKDFEVIGNIKIITAVI